MLIRILKEHLAPYRPQMAVIVLLVLLYVRRAGTEDHRLQPTGLLPGLRHGGQRTHEVTDKWASCDVP